MKTTDPTISQPIMDKQADPCRLADDQTVTNSMEAENDDKQSQGSGQQSSIKDNFSEVEVSEAEEHARQFYLAFAAKTYPVISPKLSECETLHLLHARVSKTCKLLILLDNYSWTESMTSIQKGCGLLFMDTNTSTKEKVKLNNFLAVRANFIGEITKLHDLISHNLLFFCGVKRDLAEILHFTSIEQENNISA